MRLAIVTAVPLTDTPGKARVLIVDDHAAIARALSRILGATFEVVIETESPRALARIVAGERFDAILSDVMMPDLNGVELLDAIAAIDPAQAERVVLISGAGLPAEKVLGSRPNRLLSKPFDAEIIFTTLAELCC